MAIGNPLVSWGFQSENHQHQQCIFQPAMFDFQRVSRFFAAHRIPSTLKRPGDVHAAGTAAAWTRKGPALPVINTAGYGLVCIPRRGHNPNLKISSICLSIHPCLYQSINLICLSYPIIFYPILSIYTGYHPSKICLIHYLWFLTYESQCILPGGEE